MKILALDTSTEYLTLALLLDGRLLTRELHAGQTHSQRILPMLRELLDEAHVELKDLDGIAFGAGPGSFTGLRIACGVAQGLAFGAQLPVVGVSTLQAVAEASGADHVIACLDARMAEVYHAAYLKVDGVWQEVAAPSLCKPEQVPSVQGSSWVGAGSGWAVFADVLQAQYAGQISHLDDKIYPNAQYIARLALPVFERGEARPAHEAAPIYVRNKVALKMSER